ncbi:Pantoate-beta-alanine ligase [Multifurca ochricompacta]|uniref:Pantoate--beta-alanine ligase n=1 Tax=Multifurca ochricompacta TaxID=376703 RepID=A0AAD4M981_9AGAM|nr:Pantoate-beta-alanine ligase [Multifurca ochricompacta]
MSVSVPDLSGSLSQSQIPVFTTIQDYRSWREKAFECKKTVGFVPTMGALHDGHLSLVQRSLVENELTVVSIFVNPTQFAPHEDLATYPHTLSQDLSLLSALRYRPLTPSDLLRTPSAVFLPSVKDIYPSGVSQDLSQQKGTFVEVKGYGEQMEGRSRPSFFRGVTTVVTKLFNIIQPTNAYFGQKDIQQALLLRRLVGDLHLSHPTPSRLHIIPTARDPTDGLALSSRNTYLSPAERQRAPAFYAALQSAARVWKTGASKREAIRHALELLEVAKKEGEKYGVEIRTDYVEMNDPDTFEELGDEQVQRPDGSPVILSGAVWFGRTRLIDNIILGNTDRAISK